MSELAAVAPPFLSALPVTDLFVDDTYQREIQMSRCRRMAREWDPRLVGVLEVSDRGLGPTSGRYAVINGQHRWAAAGLVDPTMSVVCNIHQGLTVADEARLFFDIDKSTKALNTWDRWKSRSAAGDPRVRRIEQLCRSLGAPVAENGLYVIKSTATLEKLHALEEVWLVATIQLVVDVWPGDSAGLRGGILHGLFPVVAFCDGTPMSGVLADALSEITPAQVNARAVARREQYPYGQIWALVTRVVVDLYNAQVPRTQRLPVDEVLKLGSGRSRDE